MDERRIQVIQENIKKMADIEKGIQPIINTCLEGVLQAADKIDHAEVSGARDRTILWKTVAGWFNR